MPINKDSPFWPIINRQAALPEKLFFGPEFVAARQRKEWHETGKAERKT
jgi:hypothetical protein